MVLNGLQLEDGFAHANNMKRFPLPCFDLPSQEVKLDLRLLGGWKKTYSPKWW